MPHKSLRRKPVRKLASIPEAAQIIYCYLSDPEYDNGSNLDYCDHELVDGPDAKLGLLEFELGLKFLLSIDAVKFNKRTRLLTVKLL